MNHFLFLLLLSTSLSTVRCDRFQRPSKDECTQAIDHYIGLTAKDATKSELGGRAAEFVGNLLLRATGERHEAISHCMGESNRAGVQCVLAAKTLKQAERCE